MHAPEAKAAMAKGGICVLAGWPARSPDLNPQENVWAHAEKEARANQHTRARAYATGRIRTKVVGWLAGGPAGWVGGEDGWMEGWVPPLRAQVRRLEELGGAFKDFAEKCVQASKAYPAPESLVPSMRNRMLKLCAQKGGSITNTSVP